MEDRRHTDRASRHWPRLLALIAADSRGTRMLPRHAARFFVAVAEWLARLTAV